MYVVKFSRNAYLCFYVIQIYNKVLKKTIALLLFLPLFCSTAVAQTRQTREEYIDKYKSIAIDHMERYGIPASITLAQGLLESDCGNSELARSSNNHFGIKCKKNWTGKRVYHDDDAKGECFRAYNTVGESYEDHATFLDTQPRYDSLFVYAADDYRSWARGLKAAGYATAPDYAQRLCRVIEENQLYLLDRPQGEALYAARHQATSSTASATTKPTTEAPTVGSGERIDPDHYRVTINAYKGYNIYATNGVNYVLAKEGDTYESLAAIFAVSAGNLRRFNETSRTAQPQTGEQVYIDRKQRSWGGNARHHIVSAGETLHSVAQSYGIRERSLRKLNRLKSAAQLQEGQTLNIQ